MQQMVRSMLTVVVCAALAAAVQAQQRVALVIGNANYQHESALRNPVNDARLIERTLKQELGFNQVFSVTNGTRVQLIRELARFRTAAQGAHTALIYYSGHGMINGKRQNYVLPVDMPKIASDANADADAELKSFALSEDDLIEAVEGASDIQLVVLDACRDNGFRTGRSGTKGLSRRADQSRNRLIAYATEEGRVAEDGSGSNSTYAASLARNLVRKELSVLAMFDAVARDVEAQTRNKQSPTRTGNLRVDVYLFNPTITVNNTVGASGVQGATPSRSDPDEEAWKAAQGADTVEGYEQYLSDFRTGRNVSAAKIKLAAAKRREAERTAAVNASVARAGPQPASDSTPSPSPSREPPRAWRPSRDCQQAYCPEMVVIPSGRFTMGGNDGVVEKPPHQVSVRSFAMSKYEVTQGQWKAVMGDNPSHFKECGDNCPVESVSWDDIQQYLQKLNQMTGQQYRLPSEAEWEYAARAGSNTKYSWGDDIGRNNANCGGCGSRWDNKSTAPVGSFDANSYGLHDMHGNVWEWVRDSYHSNYQGAPADGSAWTSGGDQGRRVVRGGSWIDSPNNARAAVRGSAAPVDRNLRIGFRVARTVNP